MPHVVERFAHIKGLPSWIGAKILRLALDHSLAKFSNEIGEIDTEFLDCSTRRETLVKLSISLLREVVLVELRWCLETLFDYQLLKLEKE